MLRLIRELKIPPRLLALATLLSAAIALFEGMGMGLLYTVLVFVEKGADASSERSQEPLRTVARLFSYLGTEITLFGLLVIVFLLILIRQGLFFAMQRLSVALSSSIVRRLQKELIAALLEAEIPFHLAHSRGAVISAATGSAGRAGTAATRILTAFPTVLLLVAYISVMLLISPLIGFVLAGLLGVMVLAYRRNSKSGAKIGERLNQASRAFNVQLNEMIHGIRLIKLRAMESSMRHRLNVIVNEVARITVEQTRMTAIATATTQPMLLLAALFSIYVAVDFGGMELASLGMAAFLIMRIAPGLTTVNALWHALAGDLKGYEYYRTILRAAQRDVHKTQGTRVFEGIRDRLRFNRVSFSYRDAEAPVLNDLNFEIGRGETVALVGLSGAGKSTTVDLIPRFLDPTSGQVTIDGVPLVEFSLSSLRRRIAVVHQNPPIFDDSIRNNLTFGRDIEVDEERLRAVLKSSACWEFVSGMPEGLETMIGEAGVRLSGGQRQRLALARAIYERPDILILDEPTSALDSISENVIQKTLRELHGSVTIIIIAHRLSTVRSADRILVLDKGRIVDAGMHDDLKHREGVYKELFLFQTRAVTEA